MFYTYIIYSDIRLIKYIGQTDDLERRIEEHNNGTLGGFTKNKRPWRLIHYEVFDTRAEAMNREKVFKNRCWKRLDKVKV